MIFKNIKKSLTLITIYLLLFSCGSSQYSSSFKAEKIDIEEILFLQPVTTIMANSQNKIFLDKRISDFNTTLIANTSVQLLSSKYNVKEDSLIKFNKEDISRLCNQLLESNRKITDLALIEKINQIKDINQERFGLLIIYNGAYNPTYESHNNWNFNKPSYINNNQITISSSFFTSKVKSELIVLLFDFKNHEIAFYNEKNSKTIDPRITKQIEQMTKMSLKSIYYN